MVQILDELYSLTTIYSWIEAQSVIERFPLRPARLTKRKELIKVLAATALEKQKTSAQVSITVFI